MREARAASVRSAACPSPTPLHAKETRPTERRPLAPRCTLSEREGLEERRRRPPLAERQREMTTLQCGTKEKDDDDDLALAERERERHDLALAEQRRLVEREVVVLGEALVGGGVRAEQPDRRGRRRDAQLRQPPHHAAGLAAKRGCERVGRLVLPRPQRRVVGGAPRDVRVFGPRLELVPRRHAGAEGHDCRRPQQRRHAEERARLAAVAHGGRIGDRAQCTEKEKAPHRTSHLPRADSNDEKRPNLTFNSMICAAQWCCEAAVSAVYPRASFVVGGFYTPAISGGVMGLVSCGDLPPWYMDGARRGLPGGRRLSALFAPPPAPGSQWCFRNRTIHWAV